MTTIEITLKREEDGQVRYGRRVIDYQTWVMLNFGVRVEMLMNAVEDISRDMQGAAQRATFIPDPEAVRPYRMTNEDALRGIHGHTDPLEADRALRSLEQQLAQMNIPNPEYAQVAPDNNALVERFRSLDRRISEEPSRPVRPDPTSDEWFEAPPCSSTAAREEIPF